MRRRVLEGSEDNKQYSLNEFVEDMVKENKNEKIETTPAPGFFKVKY
jgi:hypothetical protein